MARPSTSGSSTTRSSVSIPEKNLDNTVPKMDEKSLHEQMARTDLSRHATQPDHGVHGEATKRVSRTRSATSIVRIPTADQPPKFGLVHEVAFIAVICCAQLLTQAGLAQSIAPLHVIGNSFGTTDAGPLSWLPAGYSLTVGTFILPAGRWGDLFGHKKLFVIGWVWFAVWSLVAGFSVWADSLIFFAFCRAMQGIGPAILLPNGIAILARTYPPGPRKEMILAIFGATAPGGFVLGAIFSGLFAQLLWWPWAYWAMGIVLVVFVVLAIVVIPEMPVAGDHPPSIAELDLLGTVLGVTGLVMFNFAWNEGPSAGWDQVYVYVMLIAGVVFLAVFLFVEMRVAKYPLLPVQAFTRDTSFVFGCIAAGWASFGIWVFYVWQFFEVIRGDSILLSAAEVLPTAISGAIAAVVTGKVISKIQPGWIMLISMTAFCVGTILLATNPAERTYWAQIFPSMIITCWGMDMSFPSGVIVLSNHMPPEHQGFAASLINTVVNYSISIGLGIAGTVEAHVNDDGRDLLQGYRGAWYVGVGLSGFGICLAVGLILSWRATINSKLRIKINNSSIE